ncbi:hypothetical protein GAN75_21335 [Bacteroides thetaiotaomicron]|uniref:Uncharacterized protein n=1 Tax=Bacteroides thetaiotaomicron TaxID=818 RepID=A0A7J5JL79_BACT4|nr:hypothetical protein GAN75_21335 [Bacteroides thetaiotaomicron]
MYQTIRQALSEVETLAICYYIVLIIAHFSSILSMLSNLLPVLTYKYTT